MMENTRRGPVAIDRLTETEGTAGRTNERDEKYRRRRRVGRGFARATRRRDGTTFITNFLLFVCVGSTSHAAAARDVVVGMSETLLSSRDRKRGIVGSTYEGFGSVRFVCYECQVRVR